MGARSVWFCKKSQRIKVSNINRKVWWAAGQSYKAPKIREVSLNYVETSNGIFLSFGKMIFLIIHIRIRI